MYCTWHLVLVLLLQHAPTIEDSQLCRLRFDFIEGDTTMCRLDGRRPLITWKPTCIYSRRNTRDCLLFRELKYEVVYATKVVGEHSHPNLRPPGQSSVM